ncbi:MAG: hypothetical protein V1928_02500 [Parcubacteria group bacterium]
MHCLQEFSLDFDPSETEGTVKQIFASPAAKYIWICIKSGHVTCKEDYESILHYGKLVDDYREKNRLNYRQFLTMVRPLTNRFGRVLVDGTYQYSQEYEIDHEFWSDIFRAIIHDRSVRIFIAKNGEKKELF